MISMRCNCRLDLDVSQGDEVYTVMRGQPQQLKPGDMFIADRAGIISSILYGPDQRTQIQAATRNVMFTVYAPDGISEQAVLEHLHDIEQYVQPGCAGVAALNCCKCLVPPDLKQRTATEGVSSVAVHLLLFLIRCC